MHVNKPAYICSEIAVQKILSQYGIPLQNMPISFLKRCESLEFMEPCVNSIIKQTNRRDLSCKIHSILDTNRILQLASQTNPIAIRVNQRFNPFLPTQNRAKQDTLHTINILGRKNGIIWYDEEDNHIYPITDDQLRQWRHGTVAFMCTRN